MAAVLNVHEVGALLRGVNIPPQPELLVAAQEELARDDADPMAVARILGADPGLSAAMLRTVNSPFYGLPVKVQSVRHAVSVLGTRQTVNVVRGVALRRSLDSGVRLPMPRYWDSADQVALLAAAIAGRIDGLPADEAYTLGLFHDCGIPLLAQRFPSYRQVLAEASANPHLRFTDVEERHYQTNHAVVGYLVAQAWALAQPSRDAILDHHRVDEVLTVDTPSAGARETRLAVLALADHVENLTRGGARRAEWDPIEAVVVDYLGLSAPDFDELLEDLIEIADAS